VIPENYWTIIKNWYWLIGAFALAGAIAGGILIPMMSGATSEYNASSTLGIRRAISPGGSSTSGGEGSAADLLSAYTTSVAVRAKSPQFVAQLHDRLAAEGIDIPEEQLSGKYRVTDDPGLSRLVIDATSGQEPNAQAIADMVAKLLIEDVSGEETRLRENLSDSQERERQQLLADQGEISSQRLARLKELNASAIQETVDNIVRRGIGTNLPAEAREILADLQQITGDPELALLESRQRAIEEQLAELARIERSLATEVRGDPVVVLSPTATARSETPGTRTRDAAVLGMIAGTVMGWIAANIAESNNFRLHAGEKLGPKIRRLRNGDWLPESLKKEVQS
jgi:hypothetical protein